METTKAPWSHQPRAPLGASRIPTSPAIEIATSAALPSVPSEFTFQVPEKRITSQHELQHFLDSDTAKSFFAFILALNDAVSGKKLSSVQDVSDPVRKLLDVLETLSVWVDEIPPAAQSLRYGNPSFRIWFAKVEENAASLLQPLVPGGLEGCLTEIAPFFVDSFGNCTRIDYGTGHETTFCALLYCLAKLGVFSEVDSAALVNAVFYKYLQLMRKVQTTYWLEPAGSHGVWGLDDYQFLAFIWGSSQLKSHPLIKPKSIHNQEIMDMYGKDYMYLNCVNFVKQVKKGPLSETSPMLNDISGVPAWTKVNSGLLKMYQAEVMSKLPIMQHFLFGSLLNWTPIGSTL